MATHELNYFRVDCKRKDEQVAFLQRMRQTREEQFASQMRMMFKPWEIVTDPNQYNVNRDIAINNPNKYINFLLRELQEC